MKTKIFKPNVPKNIKNLSWAESKKRFPLMKPYSDADKDGLSNFRDCKPFDIKRKGKEHKDYDDDKAISFEQITADCSTIGDVKKLTEEY